MQQEIKLLKVLLVDDEPFIRKGLAALIDWESEGYYIAAEASNGYRGIQLLEHEEFDLIISDIKMPQMDGIEFLSYVRTNKISNARFIFLSGYYDFQYAKNAILNGCCDYVLKPIQKDELLLTIRRIIEEYREESRSHKQKKDVENITIKHHLKAIILGRHDEDSLRYLRENMKFDGKLAYIHIEISLNDERFNGLSKERKKETQRKLYECAILLIKDWSSFVIYDMTRHTQCYDFGLIYCCNMLNEKNITEDEWLEWLRIELSERIGYEILFYIGGKVNQIEQLADSYREAMMIRAFRFSRQTRSQVLDTYSNESKFNYSLEDKLKDKLDELLHMIEINDKLKIKEISRDLYRNIMDKETEPKVVNRSVQYLQYRLLGLAYNQEADINQEEIMQYIRDTIFSPSTKYKNEIKFQLFAEEFSDYLAQSRQNKSNETIHLIESEIEEKYADNISLKYLAEKYYFNSAYLGQLFKKQYGCAFKDYLNRIRLRKAAELILSTNKKVYEIAEDVGYKNQEYFINKFEKEYGMTPTRFRKRNLYQNEN